jgi:hypothetical protein
MIYGILIAALEVRKNRLEFCKFWHDVFSDKAGVLKMPIFVHT